MNIIFVKLVHFEISRGQELGVPVLVSPSEKTQLIFSGKQKRDYTVLYFREMRNLCRSFIYCLLLVMIMMYHSQRTCQRSFPHRTTIITNTTVPRLHHNKLALKYR